MALTEYVFIDCERDGYAPNQVRDTYTVGELASIFQRFVDQGDEDVKVLLRHDGGYTYGAINGWSINQEDYRYDEDKED
jgi:hypothetical protein